LHIQGSGALTGNFGFSTFREGIGIAKGSRRYVAEVIGERWVNTALLIALSFPVALFIALVIGIVGAVRQRSKLDSALTVFSFAGLSIPSFALGLIVLLFFAVVPKQLHDQAGWGWFPYFPVGGVADSIKDSDWLNHVYHAILPAATLALAQIAWLSRNIRFSMLEVLRQEYIRTARAKGVPRRRIIFKHALRNATLPLITIIGLALPGLVTGAIVVEQVFSYNGMGQLFFRSIGGCIPSGVDIVDLNCKAIGGAMDVATLLLLLNILILSVTVSSMLADVLYAVADPRINYASVRHGA
jgi:peptide/nickel transport system permease protein